MPPGLLSVLTSSGSDVPREPDESDGLIDEAECRLCFTGTSKPETKLC